MRVNYKDCHGTDGEFDVLRHIHKACMYKNIVDTMGTWDDDAQCARLQKHWDLSGHTLKFIYLGQQLIGTINVHLKDFGGVDVPFVEQFYLLPEWQGQGLGSHILQEVTNRYPEVRLSVLRNDSKAHGFYIKNGYTAYKQDDWQTYFVRESLAFYYGFNTGLNNN